jgi:hypothetical protein
MSVASRPLRSLLHSPVFLLGAGSLVSGRRVWALGLGSA